jgi:hypothetical protein
MAKNIGIINKKQLKERKKKNQMGLILVSNDPSSKEKELTSSKNPVI